MATQRKDADKAAEVVEAPNDEVVEAPADGTTAAPQPNVVAPVDGPEYGYVGEVHPDKNNDDYTVAGVTGGTAKANDKPPSTGADDTRKAWKPLSS